MQINTYLWKFTEGNYHVWLCKCCDTYHRQVKKREKGRVLKGTDMKWTNRFGQHERARAGIVLKSRILFKRTSSSELQKVLSLGRVPFSVWLGVSEMFGFFQICEIVGLQNTVVEQFIVISKWFVRLPHLSSTFFSASREVESQAECYNKLSENLQRTVFQKWRWRRKNH